MTFNRTFIESNLFTKFRVINDFYETFIESKFHVINDLDDKIY